MSKRIKITPAIEAQIRRVNGGSDIDYSKIAVYETRTLNTMQLRKRGGLYENGKVDISLLEEMVTMLNNSTEGVPLHLMHERQMLNVGKTFQARLDARKNGHYEVTSQFYLPLSEEQLVGRLDTGAVDQVSVGVLGKTVNCSECGFDWRNAGIKNYMELTCDKGHTVGKKGVHVISKGLDKWFELSLVDSGAAQDARIVNASESKFVEQADFYKLAASNQNHPETAIPLIANLSEMCSEESTEMNKEEIQALIDAALKAKADDKVNVDAAVASAVSAKDAEIAQLKETITGLEARVADAAKTPAADLQAKLDAVTADLGVATDFLKEQAKFAQIASGETPKDVETLDAAITTIKDGGIMIAKLFARHESDTKGSEAHPEVNPTELRAFARRK